MTETHEFLNSGAVPFAMKSCERVTAVAVSGNYNETEEVWVGDNLPAGTATAVVGGGTDVD